VSRPAGRIVFTLSILCAFAPVAGAARPLPDAEWRLVGPFRAGWATAVAGVEGVPERAYFGAAGGGVWRTDDAGRTWRSVFAGERSASIGALVVAPSDPDVLYAATGQATTRYDIMAGDGVYRSRDGGATWSRAGLGDSRQIGALLVHPRDPDRVLAAALGPVFGGGGERGVYLTRDGGRTWRAVLTCADSVGAVDLGGDPTEPGVVYATTWQLRMHPWLDYFMPQGGTGSGVWRSDDGGEHWRRLAGGLPEGRVGRIGIGVARGRGGRVAYACVQVLEARDGEGHPARSGLYRTDDGGEHWRLVNDDGGLASGYFGRLWVAPGDPEHLWAAGRSLLESTDGGRSFVVARGSPGGDDYHALWIDPRDERRRVVGSDQGAAVTLNGGRTWSSWYNQPTGQFYHLAADDRFPYHIYSGQQDNGTVEIASRGPYGVIEERDWHPVGGDERDYMVPKPGEPWTVFGSGLGGGVSRFDERTRQSADVSAWPLGSYGADPRKVRYRYTWITPLVLSPLPPHAMYLGAQVLFRSLDDGRNWDIVSPDLSGRLEGAGPCDDPSLEQARPCGFGVIFSIAPSPLDTAVVWVGTDDGFVRLTEDGGAHWRDVTPPGLPAWGIVSSLDLSPLDGNTAYVAVDTHRLDRFRPLAFRTHDRGRSWQPIGRGLPAGEFVSVVRCDRQRRGLLYAGTDRSVYVSFDDGESWQPFDRGLPPAWVRDLLPHGNDLLAATQGRAIWAFDDLSALRGIAAGGTRDPVQLFAPATAIRMRESENHDTPPPPETPLGANPPTGAVLDYWLGAGTRGPVVLTIADAQGRTLRRFRSDERPESLGVAPYFQDAWLGGARALSSRAGMHRFVWDLRMPRPAARSFHHSIAGILERGTPLEPRGAFVLPGRYTVTLEANGRRVSRALDVRLDPRLDVSSADLRAQWELSQAIDSTLRSAWRTYDEVRAARERLASPSSAGLRDSLETLTSGSPTGLAGAAGALTGLFSGVQSSDVAPSGGQRAAFAACRSLVESLAGRWRALQSAIPESRAGTTRESNGAPRR